MKHDIWIAYMTRCKHKSKKILYSVCIIISHYFNNIHIVTLLAKVRAKISEDPSIEPKWGEWGNSNILLGNNTIPMSPTEIIIAS